MGSFHLNSNSGITPALTSPLFIFQSMELLILSKLKWDLTAITSYDYLDYMINSLNQSSEVIAEMETQVRRNTEKLVTLCATDETFMSMPPSLVAASAFLTALEQDKSISNKVNLNQVIGCIKHHTNLEVVRGKNQNIVELYFIIFPYFLGPFEKLQTPNGKDISTL